MSFLIILHAHMHIVTCPIQSTDRYRPGAQSVNRIQTSKYSRAIVHIRSGLTFQLHVQNPGFYDLYPNVRWAVNVAV